MHQCPNCGSLDIDEEESRGELACTNCGLVLGQNTIAEEVVFSESATGQSAVVGQFVAASGTKGLSNTAKKPSMGYGRDSREQTIASGRRLIQAVADTLRLRSHHVDSAGRLFLLAVQHNFIQGRRTQIVVAACLYIVCRREKTPHLLIDFSDALQINVFILGSTFLKFVRLLNLNLPIIDPSLYIHRFAAQLKLKTEDLTVDKTHIVAMTALRLVARMKRDWMQIGRRPSGICGACLLIAARMHGFKRSIREILTVVKIGDATLRKRLLEFTQTDTSDLTFEEFETLDEESAGAGTGRDPPAFLAAREREEKLARQREAEMEKWMGMANEAIEKQSEEEIQKQIAELLETAEFQSVSGDPINLMEAATASSASKSVQLMRDLAELVSRQEADLEQKTTDEGANNPELGPPEVFDDVDDAELEQYLLSDEEVAWKTAAWERINRNYLAELEEKQRLLETLGPDAARKPKKKGKTGKVNVNNAGNAAAGASAGAASSRAETKKTSTKINYANQAAKFLIEGMMDKLIQEEEIAIGAAAQKETPGQPEEEDDGEIRLPAVRVGKRAAETAGAPEAGDGVKRNRLLLAVAEDDEEENEDDYFDEEDEAEDNAADAELDQRSLRKQLGIGRFDEEEID